MSHVPPSVQSAFVAHWTQPWLVVLHRGVELLQSPSSEHSTHVRVAVRQILLGSVGQSPLSRHATHRWLCVSH